MSFRRQHHRYWFAGKSNFLVGQDRLIVERRAVIGMRNDFPDVRDGDDVIDAFESACSRRINALDTRMRQRAAKNLAVQHSRQTQVMDVLYTPHDLLSGLETRYRLADISRRRRHPKFSAAIASMARRR